MSDCNNCGPGIFCGYPDAEWYPMSALNPLCRVQCIFLIENLWALYPPDPKETGYTGIDPAIRVAPRLTARWSTVAELRSEITGRLAKTGASGEALIEEVRNWGKNLPANVKENRIEPWQLSPEAQTALNYICGGATPLVDFETWKLKRVFTEEELISMIRLHAIDEEVNQRLLLCGDAQLVLVHEVGFGLTKYDDLSILAKLAVDYCLRRRKQTFAQWRYEREKRLNRK